MPSIIKKALALLVGDASAADFLRLPSKRPLKTLTERELITLESEIGGKLFGPIAKGHRREFFCLDANTWIWHEEWFDDKRKLQAATTRYEVHAQGILKVQEGARYNYLEGQELQNLVLAIRLYYEQVARQIYKVDPATGKKLVV